MSLPFIAPGDPETIKGAKQPTQQASRRRWQKGIGWTTVEIWEGPTEGGVFGKAQEMIIAGYTEIDFYQVRPGVWRAEGSTPTEGGGVPPEDPIDEWTLDTTVEVRPVTEHPYFNQLGSSAILLVETAVNNGESVPSATTLGTPDVGVYAKAVSLYNLLAKGTKTYYAEQPVLRHTLTFASFDEVTFSMANSLRIFTHASLPSGITPAVQAGIDTIAFGQNLSGMTQGWLKMPTTVRQNIFSRADIVEEWRFGYWETILYP
jgi:hypothetical protein